MFKVNNKDTRTTPSVSNVNFEQVNSGWDVSNFDIKKNEVDHTYILHK